MTFVDKTHYFNKLYLSTSSAHIVGKIEEAVGHFINFVHFSGDPRGTLLMLQQTLPSPLFRVICQAYAAVQEESRATRKVKPEEDID